MVICGVKIRIEYYTLIVLDILPSCQWYRQSGEKHSYTYLVDPDGPVNPEDDEDGKLGIFILCNTLYSRKI